MVINFMSLIVIEVISSQEKGNSHQSFEKSLLNFSLMTTNDFNDNQ